MKILETNELYHKNPSIGSSTVKAIHSSTPLHALTKKLDPNSDAIIKGNALHCSILEPERFSIEFKTLPDDAPRKPSASQLKAKKPSEETIKAIQFWADLEDQMKGKTILDKDTLEEVLGMKEALLTHPVAMEMLTGGEAEYSYYVQDPETGLNLKCRPDYHNGGALIDIKTTSDASYEGFARQIGNLGYHLQAAFYLDVFNASEGTNYKDFFFIAVESKAPHGVAIYRLDENHIEIGRQAYKKALNKYAEIIQSGVNLGDLKSLRKFGYSTDIIDIQVPYYLLDKISNA